MKKLAPFTIIAMGWSIPTSILYWLNFISFETRVLFLFVLLNFCFIFGFLKRDRLNLFIKSCLTGVFVQFHFVGNDFWYGIFQLDEERLLAYPSLMPIFINKFVLFFMATLSITPLLIYTYGNNIIKMGLTIAMPALLWITFFSFGEAFMFPMAFFTLLLKRIAVMLPMALAYYCHRLLVRRDSKQLVLLLD